MQVDLSFGEEPSTPLQQGDARDLEHVMRHMVWLSVGDGFIPGLFHYLAKAGHRSPENFEFENIRPSAPFVIRK